MSPAEAVRRGLQTARLGGSMKAEGMLLFLVPLFLSIGKGAGQLQSSIIGGHEASPHSRPYLVSIQNRGGHICGGALIKERWVLTAAHCLPDPSKGPIKVVVGLHNLSKEYDPEQVFTVTKVVQHSSYSRKTMAGDIMLLKLHKKVAQDKKTKLIWLSEEPAPGKQCSVAGWGVFKQGGKRSPLLRELNVKVMDTRICNNSRYWNGEVTKTMMCIEGVERGSAPCKGDSGGPVVCGKKAKVAGIISFTGADCVNMFKPTVVTAVFKYKGWIKKTVRSQHDL